MAKRKRDHYVQAAYLGAWSFTAKKTREGRLHFFDKDNPESGWRPTSVGGMVRQKGYDQLSNEEAKHLGVSTDFLEVRYIHPIETAGYTAILDVAKDVKKLRKPSCLDDVLRWVLLQYHRTPAGREILADSVRRSAMVLNPALTRAVWSQWLSKHGLTEKWILCRAAQTGIFDSPLSGRLRDLHALKWVVRKCPANAELVCCDHPVAYINNAVTNEKVVMVPLGPEALLFGYDGAAPGRVGSTTVETANGILRFNARRWVFSRTDKPSFKKVDVWTAYKD